MPEIIVKLGNRVLQRYVFDKDVLSVGRARDNDIVIENLSVSRNHSRMKRQDGKYILIDMNSSNGTLVNGVKITKTEVVHDDLITIGKHTLHFLDADDISAGDIPPPVATEPSRGSSPSHAVPSTGVPIPKGMAPIVPKSKASMPSRATVTASDSGTASERDYQPVGPIGSLTVSKGKQEGQQFKVYKSETTIGRAPVNDIRIHDWLVSNKHAMIRRDGDQYIISDLGSWRGTEVSGEPLRSDLQLKDGSEIIIGTTVLSFSVTDAAKVAGSKELVEPESEDPDFDALQSAVNIRIPAEMLGRGEDSKVVKPVTEDIVLPDLESYADDELESVDADIEDEFAPMTEDELEALDAEMDHYKPDDREEIEHRRDIWEMTEGEKELESYEGSEIFSAEGSNASGFSLIDSHDKLKAEEDRFVGKYNTHDISALMSRDEMEFVDEEMEEEEALYDGEMTDDAPYGQENLPPVVQVTKQGAAAPSSSKKHPTETKNTASSPEEKELQLWEKALKNKSKLIRKNAARELKKLTGKDYDWESQPTD